MKKCPIKYLDFSCINVKNKKKKAFSYNVFRREVQERCTRQHTYYTRETLVSRIGYSVHYLLDK